MNHPGAVAQTHHVARPAPLSQQRLDRILDALMTEVAQKRIAGAQRQESQTRALAAESLRVESVHDFVGSAIAANRNKLSDATPIGFARNLRRLPRSMSLRYLNLDAAGLQALQRRAQQFAAASASGRRIHNCEIGFP